MGFQGSLSDIVTEKLCIRNLSATHGLSRDCPTEPCAVLQKHKDIDSG